MEWYNKKGMFCYWERIIICLCTGNIGLYEDIMVLRMHDCGVLKKYYDRIIADWCGMTCITPCGIGYLGKYWFKQQLVACLPPNHELHQWWLVGNRSFEYETNFSKIWVKIQK